MDFGATNMKVAVVGLWHLGSVTAACLANAGHDVIAFDPDPETISLLKQGQAPLFEPNLDDLIKKVQQSGTFTATSQKSDIQTADIVWVTFDTPVDDQDIADVESVKNAVIELFPFLKKAAIVLISSQVPVGTTRALQQCCEETFPEKHISFACSPENLRLGKAIQVFCEPERVVVGLSSEADKAKLTQLFKPFTENLIWMSIESAEMTKHALNAFFATSVVFINELATLCEQVGADATDVERGLKSEGRIGPKAYLRPGTAIAGGTLARDVNFLTQLSEHHGLKTPLFSSLLESNHYHKQWSCRRVKDVLQDLRAKKITALGLTYKMGTDTLRRSSAIETCTWLHSQGVNVVAYDPAVRQLPKNLSEMIELKLSLLEALDNSDAIIVATEWPEFLEITSEQLLSSMKQPRVFDAGGFLMKKLGHHQQIHYYTVGSRHEVSGS